MATPIDITTDAVARACARTTIDQQRRLTDAYKRAILAKDPDRAHRLLVDWVARWGE